MKSLQNLEVDIGPKNFLGAKGIGGIGEGLKYLS